MKSNIDGMSRQFFTTRLLLLSAAAIISLNTMGQSKIVRKELMLADVGSQIVKKVDVREITLEPGQKTGYHQHPCPVVGYVVSGSVLFQVEGDTSRILKAGDAFLEPMNKPIAQFTNASNTEPLKFIAYYLLNEGIELIQMLPEKNK